MKSLLIIICAFSAITTFAAEFTVEVRTPVNNNGVATVYTPDEGFQSWATVIPVTEEAEEDLKDISPNQKITIIGSRKDKPRVSDAGKNFYARKIIKHAK